MTKLVAGLILFVGVHSISVIDYSWRDKVVERIGLKSWQGVYALVSLSGIVLIVLGYADGRGQSPILYLPPRWMHEISAVLMLPVFPLMLAAYLPGVIKTSLKHPMLVAIKLWAFAHLLANGTVADVLLFGSFLGWAVAVRISLKRRPVREIATAPSGRWNDLIAVAVGLVVYILMLGGGHAWLIGMPLVFR